MLMLSLKDFEIFTHVFSKFSETHEEDVCVCTSVCLSVCLSVAQSCLTLRDPMDCSLPGSSVQNFPWLKNTGISCHYLLQ